MYVHRDPSQFLARLAGERIHRADAIEIYTVDVPLLNALVARLQRRMNFSLSITDRELFIAMGSENLTGAVPRRPL